MARSEAVEILLVEDSEEDAELTLRALQQHKLANHVHHVKDGAQALAFLFEGDAAITPKLILLDLKLPKVDGLEVLRRVKRDPQTRSIPVVVLTSSKEDRDLSECYRWGANSYIVKPVEIESFLKAVQQVGLYWLLVNEAPRGEESA